MKSPRAKGGTGAWGPTHGPWEGFDTGPDRAPYIRPKGRCRTIYSMRQNGIADSRAASASEIPM